MTTIGTQNSRSFDLNDQDSSTVNPPIKRGRLHIIAKLSLLLMLVPCNFYVGSLVLSPVRVFYILVVPYLLLQLIKGAYGRFLIVDAMTIFYALWLAISIAINNPDATVTFVGSNVLLLFGGYLTARATIRSPEDFQAFAKFLSIVVILTLPFAFAEALTDVVYIARFFDAIPGIVGFANNPDAPRMGLDRAQVVFAHPIHYGLFCSAAFSLTLLGLKDIYSFFSRLVRSGLILLCVFFSVSSGPFLSVIFQLGLVFWVSALRRVERIWFFTSILFVIFYIIVELFSNRPAIIAIVTSLSFNAYTAYLRVTLFDYGIAQVFRTPVFGVGYNSWEMPSWMSGSIDNYWLFIAVTYGVPAFLAFFFSVAVSLKGSSYAQFRPNSAQFALRRGWCFTMVSISLTLATVAIWGNMLALVNFLLASGLWMHTYDTPATSSSENDEPLAPHNKRRQRRATSVHEQPRRKRPTRARLRDRD